MSSVAKQAVKKVDFNKIITNLGLTGSTAQQLTSFKKRHDDAKKEFYSLESQPSSIDFNHYRSILKNSKIVDEIEKQVTSFKPIEIDLSKNLKNIEIFESNAIENAKLTEKSVAEEIEQLRITLKDIQSSRPLEELTVDDVAAASDVDGKVTYMVKNGKWVVPGYREKFGDLSVM
ncbi:unnamed protein product [Candida verbasci]|uniref:ATP synthase subunit d, mitochondrial n=1 Tax=Candida verbasci TaxID=1227364 RepID=A0A9W4TR10_9ASCO|nr:unnamed protein product [Candida verbasci]